ncbi:MAG: hypothetical protein U9Q03_01420 [Patescibacteria group bacterium]|nr:hypothetical protein [Patescibacteria group bacterium]
MEMTAGMIGYAIIGLMATALALFGAVQLMLKIGAAWERQQQRKAVEVEYEHCDPGDAAGMPLNSGGAHRTTYVKEKQEPKGPGVFRRVWAMFDAAIGNRTVQSVTRWAALPMLGIAIWMAVIVFSGGKPPDNVFAYDGPNNEPVVVFALSRLIDVLLLLVLAGFAVATLRSYRKYLPTITNQQDCIPAVRCGACISAVIGCLVAGNYAINDNCTIDGLMLGYGAVSLTMSIIAGIFIAKTVNKAPLSDRYYLDSAVVRSGFIASAIFLAVISIGFGLGHCVIHGVAFGLVLMLSTFLVGVIALPMIPLLWLMFGKKAELTRDAIRQKVAGRASAVFSFLMADTPDNSE